MGNIYRNSINRNFSRQLHGNGEEEEWIDININVKGRVGKTSGYMCNINEFSQGSAYEPTHNIGPYFEGVRDECHSQQCGPDRRHR